MHVVRVAANSSEEKQIVDSVINNSGMQSRASVTIVIIIEELLELQTVNKGASGLIVAEQLDKPNRRLIGIITVNNEVIIVEEQLTIAIEETLEQVL